MGGYKSLEDNKISEDKKVRAHRVRTRPEELQNYEYSKDDQVLFTKARKKATKDDGKFVGQENKTLNNRTWGVQEVQNTRGGGPDALEAGGLED